MEFNEPKGIYIQIADQIRVRVLQGEWQVGERIPSIRELAVELGVNPNTVTKSYQTLLDKEIIINQRGKGYFVSEHAPEKVMTEMKEEFIREEIPRVSDAMRLLNIDIDELAEHLARHRNASEGEK